MKSVVWFGLVLGAVSVAGKVFYTKPGQTVTLVCGPKSFTRRLVWFHGDQRILSIEAKSGFQRKESRYSSRSKIKAATNLELSNLGEEDAGQFFCDADGTKYEHTLAVVSASASPPDELELGSKATLQCHVKGLTAGYTVQWKTPQETTPSGTESEKVELKSVASSDIGTWTCVISYNGEAHKETLVLKRKEQTPTTSPSTTQRSKDSHNTACPHCVTKPQHAVDKRHWWVWVAIGVGCLVVILLMVFVILMCKRIRRKKRKFLHMKNSRQLKGPKQYCQCNCPTAAARPQQGRRKEKPLTLHVQPLLIE